MRRRIPPSARIDGKPTRSVTSLNVRFEDKALFDHLHKWWTIDSGRAVRQWDAFNILIEAALENPRLSVPPEVLEVRDRAIRSFDPEMEA